jgi:hypothetical protein
MNFKENKNEKSNSFGLWILKHAFFAPTKSVLKFCVGLWMKKPFEGGAGMVPLRRRGERSLKPSIFCLAGEKDACFRIHKPKLFDFSFLFSLKFMCST